MRHVSETNDTLATVSCEGSSMCAQQFAMQDEDDGATVLTMDDESSKYDSDLPQRTPLRRPEGLESSPQERVPLPFPLSRTQANLL
jgi:hypothetical protein